MVGGLEAAEQAFQEAADPVVHIGTGLTLREPEEEVAVGVAVRLLQAHVVAVLPVPPVLLAQSGFLPDAYEVGVEVERAECLVGAAVRGDVHAHAFPAEELAEPLAGLLGLFPATLGQREGVVGLALVHGVVDVAR